MINPGEWLYVEHKGEVRYFRVKSVSAGRVGGVVSDCLHTVSFEEVDEVFDLEELLSKQDVLRQKFPREAGLQIHGLGAHHQRVW